MFGNTKFDIKLSEGYRFINITSDNPQAPNLVFLHGMFGGLSNFDELMSRLDGANIYVPDIPLYDMKRSELSIPFLAEWVREFMTSIGIKNPILLGNSLGGHIALQYALDYPDDVLGLVLTGSSGLLENDFGNTSPRRKDPEYIRKQANLTFYEDLADDTLVEEIMAVTESPIKLLKLLTIARSTQKHNMEDALPKINVPVLLIWGKEDIITPPEVADIFHEKMPQSELHWIEKCGHAPMMERPDQFVDFIKPFLAKFSSSNSNEKEIQKI